MLNFDRVFMWYSSDVEAYNERGNPSFYFFPSSDSFCLIVSLCCCWVRKTSDVSLYPWTCLTGKLALSCIRFWGCSCSGANIHLGGFFVCLNLLLDWLIDWLMHWIDCHRLEFSHVKCHEINVVLISPVYTSIGQHSDVAQCTIMCNTHLTKRKVALL